MAINPLQAPTNYMGNFPNADLSQQFSDLGAALIQRRKRIQEEEAAAIKQEQAQQAQEQFANDLQTAQSSGTQQAWLGMIAKYPQFREAFDTVRKNVGEEKVKNEFMQGFGVSTALENGNPQVAASELKKIIEARKNSGEPTAPHESALALIEKGDADSIKRAQGGINALLAISDPDRYQKFVAARSAQPMEEAKLTEQQAKAQSAAVAAKYAESSAVQELAKKGWDIQKIQADMQIAKQNAGIAAMNAQIAKEGNQLKRQDLELKRQELIDKRDSKTNEIASKVESARFNIDNLLNTADKVLQTPIDVVESATGPISSRLPTLSENTSDFESLVETMGAQSFLAQIPNIAGMGALSEKEGEKLQASLQNLSLRQSSKQLMANVREVQRLMLKARANVATKYGVPDTIPDTPAAEPSQSEIDQIMKKYGVR